MGTSQILFKEGTMSNYDIIFYIWLSGFLLLAFLIGFFDLDDDDLYCFLSLAWPLTLIAFVALVSVNSIITLGKWVRSKTRRD